MKKLIIAAMLLIGITAQSQLIIDLGATRTELKDNAVRLGLKYIMNMDSLYGNQELFLPGKRSFFMITPELDIQTGTEDAFSSINLKATGLFNLFRTTTVAGLITPDYNKVFHTFPISLGVETNNQFDNTNGILETGWIPYYQSYGRKSPDWVKITTFGVFLQAGYKFQADSAGAIGGEVYEGEEKTKNGILRVRGSFSVNTDKIVKIGGFNIGLVGNADGWGDIVNSAFYSKLEGIVRVFITDDYFIDLSYSHGSGAPLFNSAEQIGIGVKFKL